MELLVRNGKSGQKIFGTHASQEIGTCFIAPGFSETQVHNSPVINALADVGLGAFSCEYPRPLIPTMNPIKKQATAIINSIESLQLKPVTGVGHSLGCLALLRAAEARPDLFEGLILMQPVGMVGKQSGFELARLATNKTIELLRNSFVDRENRKRIWQAHIASGREIVRSPFTSATEAHYAGAYDLNEMICSRQDETLPIHTFISPGDELFDYERFSAFCEKSDRYCMVSSLAIRSSSHDAFWMKPQPTANLIATTRKCYGLVA